MGTYIYETAQAAIDELEKNPSKFQTLESLQKLASEVSSYSEGKVTVLYSGADDVLGAIKANPDARMIGKTAAADFLDRRAFKQAVADAMGQDFKSYGERNTPLNEVFNGTRDGDFWNELSRSFVQETKGPTFSVTNTAPDNRIWAKTELFEALDNADIPELEGIPKDRLIQARNDLVQSGKYATTDEATDAIRAKVSAQADHNIRSSQIGFDVEGKPVWFETSRFTNGLLPDAPKTKVVTLESAAENLDNKIQKDLASDNPKIRERALERQAITPNNLRLNTENAESLRSLPKTPERQAAIDAMGHQGSTKDRYNEPHPVKNLNPSDTPSSVVQNLRANGASDDLIEHVLHAKPVPSQSNTPFHEAHKRALNNLDLEPVHMKRAIEHGPPPTMSTHKPWTEAQSVKAAAELQEINKATVASQANTRAQKTALQKEINAAQNLLNKTIHVPDPALHVGVGHKPSVPLSSIIKNPEIPKTSLPSAPHSPTLNAFGKAATVASAIPDFYEAFSAAKEARRAAPTEHQRYTDGDAAFVSNGMGSVYATSAATIAGAAASETGPGAFVAAGGAYWGTKKLYEGSEFEKSFKTMGSGLGEVRYRFSAEGQALSRVERAVDRAAGQTKASNMIDLSDAIRHANSKFSAVHNANQTKIDATLLLDQQFAAQQLEHSKIHINRDRLDRQLDNAQKSGLTGEAAVKLAYQNTIGMHEADDQRSLSELEPKTRERVMAVYNQHPSATVNDALGLVHLEDRKLTEFNVRSDEFLGERHYNAALAALNQKDVQLAAAKTPNTGLPRDVISQIENSRMTYFPAFMQEPRHSTNSIMGITDTSNPHGAPYSNTIFAQSPPASKPVAPQPLELGPNHQNTKSTKAVQQLLSAAGQPVRITGNYDSNTVRAVKQFQHKQHLPEDGTIGANDFKALAKTAQNHQHNLAVQHERNMQLQHKLGVLGHEVNLTGKMDTQTIHAIREFEQAHGLNVNGKLSHQERTTLDQAHLEKTTQQTQAALAHLGYDVNVTGQMDKATQNAIAQYETDHGLKKNHVLDNNETAHLYKTAQKNLNLINEHGGLMAAGTHHSNVGAAQKALNDLGYDVPVTHFYGAKTEAVVKQFQQDSGLNVDGVFKPADFERMDQLISLKEQHIQASLINTPAVDHQANQHVAQMVNALSSTPAFGALPPEAQKAMAAQMMEAAQSASPQLQVPTQVQAPTPNNADTAILAPNAYTPPATQPVQMTARMADLHAQITQQFGDQLDHLSQKDKDTALAMTTQAAVAQAAKTIEYIHVNDEGKVLMGFNNNVGYSNSVNLNDAPKLDAQSVLTDTVNLQQIQQADVAQRQMEKQAHAGLGTSR